jgi:hypothetical protein
MTTLLFGLVAIAVVLNAYATLVLVRSPRYDLRQKSFQLGIVWLLPLAGAILVWSLAHDARSQSATANLGSSGFDDGDIRLENYSSGGHDGGSGGDGGGD